MRFDQNSINVSPMKNLAFVVVTVAAMAMGIYSLVLASLKAGHPPTTTEGVLRTASSTDSDKIELALGGLVEPDLVFVVIDTSEVNTNRAASIAARSAAETLNASGLAVSTRFLGPDETNFSTIVAQNEINRFPAVLAVKKGGGIVRIMDEISEKTLVHSCRSVWGGSSSCESATSDIY